MNLTDTSERHPKKERALLPYIMNCSVTGVIPRSERVWSAGMAVEQWSSGAGAPALGARRSLDLEMLWTRSTTCSPHLHSPTLRALQSTDTRPQHATCQQNRMAPGPAGHNRGSGGV